MRLTREAGLPVVVSMGSVAASGGYMIAVAADAIVASPGTLTGSIGVLTGALDVSGFLHQQRVSVMSVHEGTSPLGGARPLSSRQRAELKALAERCYQSFEAKVGAGRGLTKRQVSKAAEGRIWTGEQAISLGLVDALGGLDEATKRACEAAGLGAAYKAGTVDLVEVTWKDVARKSGDWSELANGALGVVMGVVMGASADAPASALAAHHDAQAAIVAAASVLGTAAVRSLGVWGNAAHAAGAAGAGAVVGAAGMLDVLATADGPADRPTLLVAELPDGVRLRG